MLQNVTPKCSSGPIECTCDNRAGTFSLKFQISLLKIWKCFEENNCDRKIFDKSFLCTFGLRFWHTWLTFLSGYKNTQKPKLATNCKIYVYHHFLKVLHWTGELCLWQPWENIFAGNPIFPFNDRKFSYKYFCFQISFWKRSSAQVGYGFENHALLFCWTSKLLLFKIQNWFFVNKKNKFFEGYFLRIFLFARWLVIWHTWLKNFARKTRKSLKLQKW